MDTPRSISRPKVWFVAGRDRDAVAFGEDYGYCIPDGGYVSRKTNALYSFPIAAVDLSTGIDTILTLDVPFKGSFPLPDNNMSRETGADGTDFMHAFSSHLLALTQLAARGANLEITLATETQSATLTFDVENALSAT